MTYNPYRPPNKTYGPGTSQGSNTNQGVVTGQSLGAGYGGAPVGQPPDLKKIESLLSGNLAVPTRELNVPPSVKDPLEPKDNPGARAATNFNAQQLLHANSNLMGFKKQAVQKDEVASVPAPVYDPGLYNDAYSRLGLMRLANICDLGCGAGNFTGVMLQRRQKPEVYLGVDNSHAQISAAKAAYPGWSFIYGDFMSPQVWDQYERYDAFLLLNVLDCLEGDLDLLAILPSGKQVLFSMPKAPREGSVRFFADHLSLKQRYDGILSIRSMGSFRAKDAFYHMVVGERW
ncbi:MAG: class I SAM-dependent methyltransferase [Deltaproteobacteria bacterium]|nr:class I SAM-dependent methyltransferase [Deltaproteobacteria bacterium]